MPGILPMKVIKVGPSAQSRIAQACDRCRSKKIRCDGITPCCSQCATVGFECKTSDKLSRRAFPRGYTESLEERVRALETEVKELKDLLDEKDEKIDILSKIHSSSPQRRPSVPLTPTVSSVESAPASPHVKEDTFKVQQSPVLLNLGGSDPCYMGASTGKTFIDAFKAKLQQTGKPCPPFSTTSFFATNIDQRQTTRSNDENGYRGAPPRLVSDQLINRFFQEWAPLFPVLHRPTFLKLYAEYTTDPDKVKNQAEIAQLNLVFAIAVLSSDCNKDTLPNFEFQWQGALESILSDNTLATLQCLVLAQIYCVCSADYKTLVRYTGAAVALAHRLGLHQSQKRFSLGALTRETRKKVFWALYTVDCFSAAMLGLPKLLKDEDVHTEYPSDVDDENVTERGFQPALPGESTRLSSALALFRLARVMSKVLGELYPAAPSYELSLSKVAALNEELESWHEGLASHLRLQFIQDKPSTNVISSRSPLISLTYYYTRTLIHRPVVTANLGPKASSSAVALSEASKRIIQIVQLLEERHMSVSIALNKNELVLLAGFALLHQSLDLKDDSKLLADNQRLACSIINIFSRQDYPHAVNFKEIACAVIAVDAFTKPASPAEQKPAVRRDSTASMPAPQSASNSLSVRKQLQAISSRFSFNTNRPPQRNVKYDSGPCAQSSLAVGNLALYARNPSRTSLGSIHSEPPLSKRTHPRSQPVPSTPAIVANGNAGPNLDYLSFNSEAFPPSPSFLPSPNNNALAHPSDWGRLLCYIEANQTLPLGYEHNAPPPQAYPPAYQPQLATASPEMLSGSVSYVGTASPTLDWASEPYWSGTSESFGQGGGSSSGGNAQSVFSLSEESLTSGEEGGGCDLNGADLGQEYLGVDWANLGGLDEGVGAGFD